MSKAYEIYKKAVGGITMNGEQMKKIEELPDVVKAGWKAIDDEYTKKKETKPRVPKPKVDHFSSKAYDEYRIKHKNAKDFSYLPDKLKNIWVNVDKNELQFLAPKPEPKKVEKAVKPNPKKA